MGYLGVWRLIRDYTGVIHGDTGYSPVSRLIPGYTETNPRLYGGYSRRLHAGYKETIRRLYGDYTGVIHGAFTEHSPVYTLIQR